MVKILGICGSPRKSSTEYALEQSLAAAEAVGGIETEMLTLRGKKINFCLHDDKCIREGADHCTLWEDDWTKVYRKVFDADGLIIASPVHSMGITGQLATFFDRFRANWILLQKAPETFNRKVGAALTVGGTRNGGQETTINVIHGFFHTQGVTIVNGGMGAYSGGMVWSKDRMAEGAAEDEIGMENVKYIGQRVAEVALKLNKG